MRFFLFCLLSCSCVLGQAQNNSDKLSNDLLFYSDVMINADSYSHRLRAHNEFSQLFEKALNSPDSWNMKLEENPFIYGKVSPDSLFKIYTFHLVDSKNITQESGFIQLNSGKVFKLKPTNYLDDIEYNVNAYDDWLGGICYHIIPFETKGETKYLLYSFAQPTEFQKRKVIDVLSFNNGVPEFGAEVFIEKLEGSRDIVKTRRVYSYSADVSMIIQYDDDFDAIVIDHLMEVKSRMPGSSGNTAVPDGTYTSYHLEDGLWIYQDAVFDQSNFTPAGLSDKEVESSKSGVFDKKSKSKN